LLFVGEVTIQVVVAELGVLPGIPPSLLYLLRRGEGLVQFARCQQSRSNIGVDIGTFALPVGAVLPTCLWPLVPVDTEPAQRIEQCAERFLGVPAGIGVLDPEHQAATGVAGECPVEQGSPNQPDVWVTGRGRGEAGARCDTLTHATSLRVDSTGPRPQVRLSRHAAEGSHYSLDVLTRLKAGDSLPQWHSSRAPPRHRQTRLSPPARD